MDIERFYEIGKVNSFMPTYQKRLGVAKAEIYHNLNTHDKPYIAVSGGKDSMVLLHLVNQVAKGIGKEVVAWSHLSNASFPSTFETIEKLVERCGIEWVVNENKDAYTYLRDKEKMKFGKSGVFFDSVKEFAADKDLAFVGTRASESKRRRKAFNIKGMTFSSKSMGDVTVCNPLAWFRLEDIASYTVENNIPMHPIYSKHQFDKTVNQDGEPYWIRLGYTTQRDLRDRGFVNFLKMNYPDIYEEIKMIDPTISFF